ncbi:unnamed protein product [Linum tenue]|uniref:RING-type domain-containing protein n=2 Tax=Linum TaxID=4005 RepID=A0AAV0JHW6_9ROSI|nr:unnamed protein product [Linum tenue]
MESSGGNSDPYRVSSGGTTTSGGNSRRYGLLSASSIIQAPISALLEYSGLLRTSRSTLSDSDSLIPAASSTPPQLSPPGTGGALPPSLSRDHLHRLDDPASSPPGTNGEVSIRIIGAGDHHDSDREASSLLLPEQQLPSSQSDAQHHQLLSGITSDLHTDSRPDRPSPEVSPHHTSNTSTDGEASDAAGPNGRDSSYQRYDIQQAARWIEQILPFSLLLLVVFIRQHLQGFFVTIWIAVVMFKSNDILRKQTALKGERKISVLAAIALAFTLHVVGVYWWYQNDDLLYPLFMLPPKSIPPFWHAVFIIMVNDTLVRQGAMVLKCFILMYYKNSRGRNYRRQGQMLTLVEYLMLLYRALLPTPVWYRFFLNKEYGSLFSSLMTGLYLTFKLTSVVEKVQSFFAALKALSRKEVHYGAYATSEQVNAAGDLCAICQEKMHAPILLRCKHIFCEDCVSEWFERERTCPLCRATVKPADLRSFGDGSTSLFFQIF